MHKNIRIYSIIECNNIRKIKQIINNSFEKIQFIWYDILGEKFVENEIYFLNIYFLIDILLETKIQWKIYSTIMFRKIDENQYLISIFQ